LAPYRYAVHGLTLESNALLDAPGFRADRTGSPDVVVDWAGVAGTADPTPPDAQTIVEATGGWLAVSPSPGHEECWTRLRFGYAGHHVQFEVDPTGTRVVVTWTPEVPRIHVSTLLLSTVMGYLLFRLGRLALHGSVIAWRGEAFVVAGVAGAGKSTTVTALIQRGCSAISDDVAALTRQRRSWAVFPGVPGIRLTPEAREALRIPAAGATPLWPREPPLSGVEYERLEDKGVVSFPGEPEHSSADPLPLAGIFLLPPRAEAMREPVITPLPAAAAVPYLAAQLLTPAWLAPTISAERFETLADLAGVTPVRTVERPDSLAALPRLCDALLQEMERLGR
jgi:hypothetical protein